MIANSVAKCSRCHKRDPAPRKRCCAECVAEVLVAVTKQRERAIAAGLCTSCRRAPAAGGKRCCDECRRAMNAKRRHYDALRSNPARLVFQQAAEALANVVRGSTRPEIVAAVAAFDAAIEPYKIEQGRGRGESRGGKLS